MTGPDRAEEAQGVPGDKPAQGADAASRPPGGEGRPLIRAAQYIRMSTEHQQYSTENQSDVIREYAAKRGYQIVRTYTDAGKSGLRIEGRDALKRLLEDVQSGKADFKAIIAYDVSRWGRFQDADESAYYEYICKRVGIQIVYCAEQFENDGSLSTTIIKSMKRAMAGEYSRELSTKVFKGQCKLIEMGYRQGGPAGYGLRRMLVDIKGEEKGLLKRGEHKCLQTDRVILVPGPEEEIGIVQRIYGMFTREGMKEKEIAEQLNAEGLINVELDRPWSGSMIRQVLSNEKYIGNNLYNRVSFKLKKKRVLNAPDMWVRRDGAFKPIVEPELFYMARGILVERSRRFTDEEMLALLRELYAKLGTLTGELINESEGMPAASAYHSRFGSLIEAYRRIGFVPERDYRYVEINRRLRGMESPFVEDVIRKIEQIGGVIAQSGEGRHFLINGEFTAGVVFTRCSQTPAGTLRWLVNLERESTPDITVVVRMDAANEAPMDFYFLPRIDIGRTLVKLGESNGVGIDTYRYGDLGEFVALAARAEIEAAA